MAAIKGAPPIAGPNDLSTLTITALMARFNVPGVSIAVIRDHQIHWAKGYGIADIATGAPPDTGTVFQAVSISKPVAAMTVLRAVQDSELSRRIQRAYEWTHLQNPPRESHHHAASVAPGLTSVTINQGGCVGLNPGRQTNSEVLVSDEL
jgi:hypothetical protein